MQQLLVNKILGLDLFSLPIYFTLGPIEKAKKTLFGGIVTILIAISSFIYFVYLCNLYFSNSIQPTISTTNVYIDEEHELNMTDDQFGFRIQLGNGQTLQEYEEQIGKKFVFFVIGYNYTIGENKYNDYFESVPCKNEHLLGYYCIKMDQAKTGKNYTSLNLKYFDNIKPQNLITLGVAKCIKEFLIGKNEVCEENDEEIKKIIFNFNASFKIKTVLKQFNPKSKKYEQRIKIESYLFDDNLTFLSAFQFQQVQTRIIDGLIVQSTQIENNYAEYQRSDSMLSRQYTQRVTNVQLYGLCVFQLGTNKIVYSVQYSLFTSILAQFISVVNSLLLTGIICKKFAKIGIIQDLLALQLKVYYKKTALDIIKQSQKQQKRNYEVQNQFQLFKSIQDSNIISRVSEYTKMGFISRQNIYKMKDNFNFYESIDEMPFSFNQFSKYYLNLHS